MGERMQNVAGLILNRSPRSKSHLKITDSPIDSVFRLDNGPGWRASQKGERQIRIIFDQPWSVHRIQLRFVEPERERTQASNDISARRLHSSEIEDYEVDLEGVSVLELAIQPDLTRGAALATLATWRVA